MSNPAAHRLMSVDVIVVNPQTPLSEAWEIMMSHSLKHMPVVEDGNRLVGMVVDRDLLRLWLSQSMSGNGGAPHKVRDIMQKDPFRLPPTATAGEIARQCRKHRIDAMPITDGDGQLLGLVTSSDLLDLVVAMEPGPLPMTFRLHHSGSRATDGS